MSEGRKKLLYLLAFVGFILIAASSFAESADKYIAYVGIVLFVALNAVVVQQWWKRQITPEREEPKSKLRSLVQHLLRSSWPF